MKTLKQYIIEKLLDHKSNPTASQSPVTEKLKISKSKNRSIDVDVDPRVEKAVKKVVSAMNSSEIITNKVIEFFYKKTREVSTPGIRFFKWEDYYDMSTRKDHRDLGHNESVKYYSENGQIIVCDTNNEKIAGLLFINKLYCDYLNKINDDTYLVILSSDPIILNKEAYEEIVLAAIEQDKLFNVNSIFTKNITFDGRQLKNTDVVPDDFLNKILNN